MSSAACFRSKLCGLPEGWRSASLRGNLAAAKLRGAVCTQVVVQGIPWAYTDQDLAGLFHEVGTVEQASVVYSKDGRSRVRPLILIALLKSWSMAGLAIASAQLHGEAILLKACMSGLWTGISALLWVMCQNHHSQHWVPSRVQTTAQVQSSKPK